MDIKIEKILRYLPRSIYLQKLEYLKGSDNYLPFLNKLLKELKENKKGAVTELDVAYDLKKQADFNVCFMPEKKHLAELIPGFNSNQHYNRTEKPDLWIYVNGNWIFVEIKTIRRNIDSILSPNEYHQIIVNKIKNKLMKCIAQTKCFGSGLAYIKCEKGILDLEIIKKEIKPIFKQNSQLMGLVLKHNKILKKREGYSKIGYQINVIPNEYNVFSK